MKLVTVLSTAAFVLVPAVAFAEEPGNTGDESGVVQKTQKAIGAMTGRSSKEDAQSGDKDSNAGNTNYPDYGAIKKTGK